ncbi:uncharacterized protein EV420DRAFT_1481990 [Desarmillaria tabescens]|uniref:Uncharacterized protein n=1 Tax=Armillaria tabescens TaxID=1929756 RepID=A0AA39MZT9_ARMTA|nr:uncharacterized protein EV420DRAFT_1481990 [Desarmillaria tabescens]KAK0453001.1 hypothetical protein EV420DRAFT_1481990 [Desarmillaria tabescens]
MEIFMTSDFGLNSKLGYHYPSIRPTTNVAGIRTPVLQSQELTQIDAVAKEAVVQTISHGRCPTGAYDPTRPCERGAYQSELQKGRMIWSLESEGGRRRRRRRKFWERDWERQLGEAQEHNKMSNLVVSETDHLEGELVIGYFKYEVEIRNKENDRVELAKAQAELENLKLEDNSAAKMEILAIVYKLAFQASLVSIKERHAAMLDQSRADTEKLRLALDQRGFIKNSHGCSGREHRGVASTMSVMRKIIERGDDASTLLERMLRDAHGFASDLNGFSESMGQIIVAENAIDTLIEELRIQTAWRLELEKLVVLLPIPVHQKNIPEPPASEKTREDPEEARATLEAEESDSLQEESKMINVHRRSPRSVSQSTSIIDELAPSSTSTSTSTLITSDPIPFPTEDEPSLPAEVEQVLHTATEQLDDYAEDARVKMEIRIEADETLVLGFETILTVLLRVLADKSGESQTLEEVKARNDAFISGSDPVKKTQQNLSQKLANLHDLDLLSPISSSPSSTAPGWMSWTSSTTAFGNVMTNPKLRQAQSMKFQTRKDLYTNFGLCVVSPPFSSVSVENQGPRPRPLSAMYSLGLARDASGTLGSGFIPPTPRENHVEETEDGDDDDDGDVEGNITSKRRYSAFVHTLTGPVTRPGDRAEVQRGFGNG